MQDFSNFTFGAEIQLLLIEKKEQSFSRCEIGFYQKEKKTSHPRSIGTKTKVVGRKKIHMAICPRKKFG